MQGQHQLELPGFKTIEASATAPLTAVAGSAAETHDADILNHCLRRIRAWRVPPNWSAHDWFGEMRMNSAVALWKAKCDYDPNRGVPLDSFERLRVIASARTRYRQEWSYALHCPAVRSPAEEERQIDAASGLRQVDDPVREALAQIPEADRCLLEQLFWAEYSEATVARKLGVSQQAVSKRKKAALKHLRYRLVSGQNISAGEESGCGAGQSVH